MVAQIWNKHQKNAWNSEHISYGKRALLFQILNITTFGNVRNYFKPISGFIVKVLSHIISKRHTIPSTFPMFFPNFSYEISTISVVSMLLFYSFSWSRILQKKLFEEDKIISDEKTKEEPKKLKPLEEMKVFG